jgi:hypothetical protein
MPCAAYHRRGALPPWQWLARIGISVGNCAWISPCLAAWPPMHAGYDLDLFLYHRGAERPMEIAQAGCHPPEAGAYAGSRQRPNGVPSSPARSIRNTSQRTLAPGPDPCAGNSAEHVELLRPDESGIRTAAYIPESAPRKLLETTLHQAICAVRARRDACQKKQLEPHIPHGMGLSSPSCLFHDTP